MKKNPLAAKLRALPAYYCGAADKYLEGRVSADKAWRECPRGDWMLWLLRITSPKKTNRIVASRPGDCCDDNRCSYPECVEWREKLKKIILKIQPKCPRIPK